MAQVDLPGVHNNKRIQRILRPANIDTRYARWKGNRANHSFGPDPGFSRPSRESVPLHHSSSHVAAGTEDTTEISLSRDPLPELADCEQTRQFWNCPTMTLPPDSVFRLRSLVKINRSDRTLTRNQLTQGTGRCSIRRHTMAGCADVLNCR